MIAKHQRNLPVEVSGGIDQVQHWYAGKLDFSVRVPQLRHAAARCAVDDWPSIRDYQAAYLVYDVNGNKVSVFIFDPSELPIEPAASRIGNREVYFDEERGYNVALFRDRGVGYAIASDLDQEQMVKLVSSAVAP